MYRLPVVTNNTAVDKQRGDGDNDSDAPCADDDADYYSVVSNLA